MKAWDAKLLAYVSFSDEIRSQGCRVSPLSKVAYPYSLRKGSRFCRRNQSFTMAYLEIHTDRQAGRQFDLGNMTSLGRHNDNDLILSDCRASRRHARIIQRGESFFLEDLSSSNGTYLRDQQLPPSTPSELAEDDEIRIGSTRLVFHMYRFISSSSEIPRPTEWLPNPP